MFKKILIANRGDQRQSRAAAKLNSVACEACAGYFTAKVNHV
jgi:biotin carboxylase